MEIVRHRQRQSRLHQRRDEQQFATGQCDAREPGWNNQAERASDEFLQSPGDEPQVQPELSHRCRNVQVVACELQETQTLGVGQRRSLQNRHADGRDNQHRQKRQLKAGAKQRMRIENKHAHRCRAQRIEHAPLPIQESSA